MIQKKNHGLIHSFKVKASENQPSKHRKEYTVKTHSQKLYKVILKYSASTYTFNM